MRRTGAAIPDLCDFWDCELETLRLLAVGYTRKQIACQMHVTRHTVEIRAYRARDKLGSRTVVSAVANAIWAGLITAEGEEKSPAG